MLLNTQEGTKDERINLTFQMFSAKYKSLNEDEINQYKDIIEK